MIREKEFTDESLGPITIKINPRARHIILRTRAEGVFVTIPPCVTSKEIKEVLDKYRERLKHDKQNFENRRINLDYKIDTELFKLSLINGTHHKFLAHSELGKLEIICPPAANFEDEELQKWLRKVIEEALRRNAKVLLPVRLQLLSQKWKLPYEQVRINSSKGRWGSCSAQRHINLSFYLLLLPAHLVDYVLLHELSHTIEMNHGASFWKQLDSLTDGKALTLREELKKYKTEL